MGKVDLAGARALIELQRNLPSQAIANLEAAIPYDLVVVRAGRTSGPYICAAKLIHGTGIGPRHWSSIRGLPTIWVLCR